MIQTRSRLLNMRSISLERSWLSCLGIAHGDDAAKVSAEQRPSRVPTVTLNQAAQGQDSLSTFQSPGHARLLEALSDEGLAGGLDVAAADGQFVPSGGRVVHAIDVAFEVGDCLVHRLLRVAPRPLVARAAELREDLRRGFAGATQASGPAMQLRFRMVFSEQDLGGREQFKPI